MLQDDSGHILVQERIVGLSGQPGIGVHLMNLSLELTLQGTPPHVPQAPPPLPKFTLYDFGAVIRLSFPKTSSSSRYLGRAIPDAFDPIESRSDTATRSVQLQLVLDREQLESAEILRNGGDVFVELNAFGEIQSGTVHRRVRSNSPVTFRANISTWTEVIEQMGYGATLLLQVPFPTHPADSGDVVRHLRSAEAAILRGHYRDAVGVCRDALEALTGLIGDDDTTDPVFNSLFQNSKGMDKEQRLKVLRRALKVMCHPARHVDEVTTSFTWDREDAVAVVAMIAALIPATVRSKSK